MKKWELIEHKSRDQSRHRRSLASKAKRLAKLKAESPQGYDPYTRTVTIPAPKSICIYGDKECETTLKYISRIRKAARERRNIHLNFNKTDFVSAAGMLLLLANVDYIRNSHTVKISATRPIHDKTECIFNQTGFTEILGKKPFETDEYEDVSFWHTESGRIVDAELAKSLFAEIESALPTSSKQLMRAFQEAIANSVEHAYKSSSHHSRHSQWWAFGGIRDDMVVLVVCDLGIGIPNSLPNSLEKNWLEKTLDLALKTTTGKTKSDALLIKAATMLRQTATGKQHRGKGLNDIKKAIDKNPGSSLIIYSNRGSYNHIQTKKRSLFTKLLGYKGSINGTIIEWQMPLGV